MIRPWSKVYGRAVLLLASVLFTLIGLRNVFAPLEEASAHAISLGAPEAVTIMRAMGSVFVGIAAVLVVSSLSSDAGRLAGLRLLMVVMTSLTLVRMYGLIADGNAPFTRRVLVPEIVLVLISTSAYLLERRRRSAMGPADVADNHAGSEKFA
jgi:hypothetical protein